jgi:predicted enzyme related to lactoylglutathione lyase
MHHPPGVFCWAGLAASDPDMAKPFYEGLFGWRPQDRVASGIGEFATMRYGSKAVALVYRQTPEARAARVPPHWTSFISVEDADRAEARVVELGGIVVRDSFEVDDLGRVATIRDPTGAIVSLWQPRTESGAELRNVVGGLAWNELSTANPERAATFYGELFGWSCAAREGLLAVQRAGVLIGVIREQHAEERGRPPNWLPCFAVDDLDAAGRRAMALGGRVLGSAGDAPVTFTGRTVRLADPLGADFAVWDGR